MKTVYVRAKTKDEARKRAEWLYMILRDYTPVIADLHTSKAQVVTESMVIKYVPENYTMDGIRCDIAIGFGQLGKIIARENISDALMISLQLDGNMKTSKKYNETIKEQQEEIDSLKKEIEMLQQEHEDAIAEIEQDAAVYVEENKKIANMEKTEDTIRLQTERDTYKTMYEQLLNRLVNGGAA